MSNTLLNLLINQLVKGPLETTIVDKAFTDKTKKIVECLIVIQKLILILIEYLTT